MSRILCKLSDARTRKLAKKYSIPENVVRTIEQTVESETPTPGSTVLQTVEIRIREWIERFNNPTSKMRFEVPFYRGDIVPSEDTIFVFGSNPTGKHGAGNAKAAVTNFGAIMGQGEGLQGNSYALPTKRLDTVKRDHLDHMAMYFDGGNREDVLSQTPFEAIINGERTSATRYFGENNPEHLEKWKGYKVGDIIEFTGPKGYGSVYVRVTKPLIRLTENTNAEEWSSKEGWSTEYFKKTVVPQILEGKAYQLEYEYVGASGTRTVTSKEIIANIRKMYAVAAANPTKKFKVAFRNNEVTKTYNGYTGKELMTMFLSAGTIPSNVIFSEEWAESSHFKGLYSVVQSIGEQERRSPNPKDVPVLKRAFRADANGRGKLIYAQSGTGKTTISDNVNIIDGDYILAGILNCPVSLVSDAWNLIPKDELANYSKRYAAKIEEYLKNGKTVVTTRERSLPLADYIIYRDTVGATVASTAKERANSGLSTERVSVQLDKIKSEVRQRGNDGTVITLSPEEHLGDILLENPTYNGGSLQGRADRRSAQLTLTEIIQDFLHEFGIESEIGAEVVEDIDVAALNRIIKARTAEDLPIEAGRQIALMSLYHAKMKPIVAEMIDRKNSATKGTPESVFRPDGKINDKKYAASLKNKQYVEYCEYIGKYMGQVLREEYGERRKKSAQNPSFIDKLLTIVRDIINKLKQHAFYMDELDKTCRSFATHVLANNPWNFKSSLSKPKSTTRAQIVDANKVMDTYLAEASLIQELEEKKVYLAGSLSMAFQGEVYRPDENPVHDLDFAAAYDTQEELEEALYSLDRFNKENLQLKTIIKDSSDTREGHATYTYVYLDRPFKMNSLSSNKGELVDPSTNEVLAVYEQSELTILADNTFGKMLDFFVHGKNPSIVSVTLNNGKKLDIVHWKSSMSAKVDWVRLTDLFDFNRYITNEFKQRYKKFSNALEYAIQTEVQETEKEINYANNRRRIDPTVKQYRHKMLARDFVQALSTVHNDLIYNLKSRLDNAGNDAERMQLSDEIKNLEADNGLAYYISRYSLEDAFAYLKNDYSDLIDTDDDILLDIFPTSHPDGANYVREQLSLIIENFDSLVEGSLAEIESLTGMRITLIPKATALGERSLGGSIAEDENAESINDPQDEDVSVRIEGNTSFKIRQEDNYKTLSNKVRSVLSNIVATDASGNTMTDDLGTTQYLNARNTHGILIDEMSWMTSSEDFAIKTENEEGEVSYNFPALEKVVQKYAWAEQIIRTLRDNPRLIGAFSGAFRRDFIQRYVYTDKKGLSKVNEKAVFYTAWKELNQRLESGIPVSKASIYTASGIQRERIPGAISYVSDTIENIRSAFETDEEIFEFAARIENSFATVGISVDKRIVSTMLKEAGYEGRKTFKDALSKVLVILDNAQKEGNQTHSLLNQVTKSEYRQVLELLNIASDSHNEVTYREKGKSYSSHTVPGYIETLFKKLKTLKGAKLEEFVNREFKDVTGPFYAAGQWLNVWLKTLMDPNTREATQHQLFDTCELSHVDGVEYSDWTPSQITKGFLAMFLEGDIAGQKTKPRYGYYNAPIFSDSPVVKFIKFTRYSNELGSVKDIMLPLFRNVVKQELRRIAHVVDRRQALADGRTREIANYDKRGAQFFYFDALNTPEYKSTVDQMKQLLKTKNVDGLNQLIDEVLPSILEAEFEEFKNYSGIMSDSQVAQMLANKGYTTEEQREDIVEEYFYNQMFATTQIIQLTVTDPAYYKDAIEFQKRFKETYAAGIKPNTETQFGKKTEKCVYLKDRTYISRTLERIKSILDRAVSQGRILSMDRDNILRKFNRIEGTDGQALRSLPSVKRLWDMLGKLPEVEASIDRIIDGKWDMSDLYTIFQTIKPFVFTNIQKEDGLGGKMRVGHQQKDSEYIMLLYATLALDTNNDSEAKAIQDFMVENDIDVVAFETCVKTGSQGTIDIYHSAAVDDFLKTGTVTINGTTYTLPSNNGKIEIKDREGILDYLYTQFTAGKYTQDDINAIVEYLAPSAKEVYTKLSNGIYKQDAEGNIILDENGAPIIDNNVVHEIPYDDYCITMSTDGNHLVDSETIFGTQFNTLITADLTDATQITIGGKTYKGQEIRDLYQSIKIENIIEDFTRVQDIFSSPADLVKEIYKRIDANSKYNKGIKQALKLVSKKDPVTGNVITKFASPLINPIFADQVNEIIFSIFKNKITKQKIKGGTAYLVADVGFTKELQIQYKKDENGNDVIDYIPCYLPCTMKDMFADILVEKRQGELTYWALDINAKDPSSGEYVIDRELLNMIGYRIPTEHKYSMAPLRVIGFLPQQNGSSIMLPSEAVTVLSGADFDIDKLFLMMYECEKQKYNIEAARRAYSSSTDGTVSFENWYKNNKAKFLRDVPVYRKIKYSHNKTATENSRKQRNNLLLDISRSVLASSLSAEAMHKPQGFDSFIRGAEITKLLQNPEFIKAYIDTMSYTQLANYVLSRSTDELRKLNEQYAKHISLISPTNFLYFHSQNMAGNAALGAYANNTTVHCKMQGTGISMRFPFKFNGVTRQALDGIYTTKTNPITGEEARVLISQLCCEGVGASADNAKNPTISIMMQKLGTIRLTALLMRAGLAMDDIALFFAQPHVVACIKANGNLSQLETYYKDLYGDQVAQHKFPKWEDIDIKKYNFTSTLLAAQAFRGSMIDELDGRDKEQYEQWDYVIGKLISELWKAATASGEITSISRADSTNGAISHTLTGAITQMQAVDNVQKKSRKKAYPLQGIGGAPINVGEQIFRSGPQAMRDAFAKSGNPLLQACYSCGIEFPQYILRSYFAGMSPVTRNYIYELNDDAPTGTLKDNLSTSFLKKYVVYRLGTLPLFRKHGKDFMENRQYYLKEFPAKFQKILRDNSDIASLELIQKIRTKDSRGRGYLYIQDSNLITEIEADRLRESLDALLYMENPVAQELAEDLFAYCYYSHSLAFLPDSFTRFFSTEFQNAMPGYNQSLERIEQEMSKGYKMDEFTKYWYNNHLSSVAVSTMTLGQNISSFTAEDGDVYYVSKSSKNTVGEWRNRIKLKVTNVLGEVEEWKALELVSAYSDAAYYKEVPSYLGMSFYNPDISLEETIEIAKQYAEEEAQQAKVETEAEAWKSNALGYTTSEFEEMSIEDEEDFFASLGGSNFDGFADLEDMEYDISNAFASPSMLDDFTSEYPADPEQNEDLCPPKTMQ